MDSIEMARGTLHIGDVRDSLRALPDNSVHCVVTSPPYWGLRDYGVDGQLGLEPTPEEYVANMGDVFRAVWRVLRDDGVLWLNLGASYASGSRTSYDADAKHAGRGGTFRPGAGCADGVVDERSQRNRDGVPTPPGFKPKDLVPIPWLVALALQADGWYLRSDIIWSKPNCMPSSVTDRPTASHEYVFLLSKSPRYYYDGYAVREPSQERASGNKKAKMPEDIGRPRDHLASSVPYTPQGNGRNRRSVWTVATESFSGAHFATFPRKLIEPCILAGTSAKGCCPDCGAPWERVVEKEYKRHEKWFGDKQNARHSRGDAGQAYNEPVATRTVGWRPTCVCGCVEPGVCPDDWDIVETPTGERVGDDPTITTGRAGFNRPRHPEEGSHPRTRYEQRKYAAQLKTSPHRAKMEGEAGPAFAHYIRTDASGARPVPHDLLAGWLERGWLTPVSVPEYSPPDPIPCTVLDPFLGSGTTACVAIEHGRAWVGCELNPDYAAMAIDRIANVEPRLLNDCA